MPNPDEIRGVDFSFARIPAAQLLQYNVHHVFRYLAYLPNGKVITKPEYDDDIAHGINVHLNWETTAGRPLDGAGAGSADGHEAGRQCDILGYHGTIICSLDTDPNALSLGQLGAVISYCDAFASASGRRIGIYGGARLIDFCFNARGTAWEYWQPAAWSGQYLSPHANYYQRIGHTWRIAGVADNQYDEDVVIPGAPTPPPPPPPPPAPVTKGNTMTVNIASGLVKTTHYGYGQCVGELDAGTQVRECLATVHGPDPHVADPSSPDDFWPPSIGATVRAQVRGHKVVVTVSAPHLDVPLGAPGPTVHVVAFV